MQNVYYNQFISIFFFLRTCGLNNLDFKVEMRLRYKFEKNVLLLLLEYFEYIFNVFLQGSKVSNSQLICFLLNAFS